MVLGVIGSDCHSVGNRILDGFFTEKGWRVVNLGVMVSQDEFIDAAIETGADAILVSSLYGQGEIDCAGFRDRCVERGLEDMLLYVGGNLVVGKVPRESDRREVRRHGLRPGLHALRRPGGGGTALEATSRSIGAAAARQAHGRKPP